MREVRGGPGEIAKATQERVVFETALDGGSKYCREMPQVRTRLLGQS